MSPPGRAQGVLVTERRGRVLLQLGLAWPDGRTRMHELSLLSDRLQGLGGLASCEEVRAPAQPPMEKCVSAYLSLLLPWCLALLLPADLPGPPSLPGPNSGHIPSSSRASL